MTIAAKISADEVTSQVVSRFVDTYYEARIINAPGVTYTPGVTDDTTFLASEVPIGTGGYQRQVIGYVSGDVATYADGGVGLAQKATVFAHDGGGTLMLFTHVALVKSSGNITDQFATITGNPATMADGTYTNIPADSTSGSGAGAEWTLVVSSGGTVFSLEISKVGYDYAAADTFTITNATLQALDPSVGAGDLTFSIDAATTATSESGNILAVAKPTNSISLGGGNEAVFYWNLKQFGFYS